MVVTVGERQNREAREDGVAVFAALEIEVVAKNARHAGEFGEFDREVAAVGAFDAFVYLLQGDDVSFFAFDECSDARQVDPFVEAFTVMDVVGHHAEGIGGVGLGRAEVDRKRRDTKNGDAR